MTRISWSIAVAASSAAGALAAPVERSSQVIQLDLNRIVNQTLYGIEVEIGTPAQKMQLEIDTGSPYTGVAGTHSNWCQLPSRPCAAYGSYDNTTSSTAEFNSSDFFNALINHGYGDSIIDTISLGGQQFSNTSFGMVLNYQAGFPAPAELPGVIGLVPSCYNGHSCEASAPTTLQQQLVQKGSVHRNTLGMYLGPDDPNAVGQLLFGAMDTAKQSGTPVTFPVIPISNEVANSAPNMVNFSSLAVTRSGGEQAGSQAFHLSTGSYGILDSGTPGWALPSEAYSYVQSYFQLGQAPEHSYYNLVDCKFRSAQSDGAKLVVGFANDQLKIEIPLERLVTEVSAGQCATTVHDCGSDGEGCAFGNSFLRSTYTFFDFDASTVTMSNVAYTSDSQIVAT